MSWIKKIFGGNAKSQSERVVPIATVQLQENSQPQQLYGDQVMRKEWMGGVIEEQGIPVNKHLPCIESEAEVTIRTPQEIAQRLIALTAVAVKGKGLEQEHVEAFLEDKRARSFLSPKELAFIDDAEPSEHDRIQFAWQYECAWVMLWALKFLDGPLEFPGSICDVPKLVEIVRDTQDLTWNGTHVPNNILNEADLIYRYHWAVRQASLDGTPTPGGLEAGVVMERHKALNWLISYCDADWDDVGTDT
jgi:hypothetical protein